MAILPLEPAIRRSRRPRVLGARSRAPGPRRVAVLSIHTSPLDQPGTGDAGGMNVYVVETARRLAEPRRRGRDLHPGHVRRPAADGRDGTRASPSATSPPGPFEGLARRTSPASCAPSPPGVLRAEAARPEGWYDLVHSHYWLSGQVGWLAAERWNVPAGPLDAHDGQGQEPRPRRRRHPRAGGARDRRAAGRRRGRPAHRQHRRSRPSSSSTSTAPTRVSVAVVHPGVDLDVFTPGDRARGARAVGAARRTRSCCCSSAGSSRSRLPTSWSARPPRWSRATRRCATRCVVVDLRRPVGQRARRTHRARATSPAELGVADLVRFVPPADRAASGRLVPRGRRRASSRRTRSPSAWSPSRRRPAARRWSRRASGGLRTAVADGVSGTARRRPRPARLGRRRHRPAIDRAARACAARAAGRGRPACTRPRFGWASRPTGRRCSTQLLGDALGNARGRRGDLAAVSS